MARRKATRSTTSGGWARWWWLALPALGVAAWAAFDATLGFVSSDPPVETAPVLDSPRAAIAPQEPTLAPVAAEPSATPAARAVADGGPKAAKRKPPAPKENITEQDRRALERVLERATEQGTR